MIIDIALVVAMLAFALAVGTPISDTLPFALIILIASVNVALRTTFTVAQAVGAQGLSKGAADKLRGHGVFVTRLSAIQEAASMDVAVHGQDRHAHLQPARTGQHGRLRAHQSRRVARARSLVGRRRGRDPIDLAILRAAGDRVSNDSWEPIALRALRSCDQTCPKDLPPRRAHRLVVVKGMPPVVAELSPPRHDSAQLVGELRELGIDVKMITGDTAATAAAIGAQVGIDPSVSRPMHCAPP
jgi:H+-transporting ATPase